MEKKTINLKRSKQIKIYLTIEEAEKLKSIVKKSEFTTRNKYIVNKLFGTTRAEY